VHINSASPNQVYYLAIEGGTNRTSGLAVQGVGFANRGGVGVWKNLHAGVAFSRFNQTTATTVTGAIPHPFFFSRTRSIDGEVTGLKREETAIDLQARVVLPATRRITAAVFAGPSWFSVKQGIVGGIQYGLGLRVRF
jgi:hypothetical protein